MKNATFDTATLQLSEIAARDREADDYVEQRRRSLGAYGERAQVQLMLSLARLRRTDRLLDAGCGVGRTLIPASRRVRSAVGVDFSPRSIELLKVELQEQAISNVEAHVGDLTTAHFDNNSFDVVLSQAVIHHVPSAHLRLQAMRSLYTAMKPGGRIVLLLYRWGGGKIRPPKPKEGRHPSGIYYFAFTPAEARSLLADAGFERIRVRGAMWLPDRLCQRLPAWMSWMEPLFARIPFTRCGLYLAATARKPA